MASCQNDLKWNLKKQWKIDIGYWAKDNKHLTMDNEKWQEKIFLKQWIMYVENVQWTINISQLTIENG